jgi:two-component system KDP operon response regulator KdpE
LMDAKGKKQRVLVVDDHPKVLRFIEIDLKIRGFEVVTTTSGNQALELVKSAGPDIMLLDIVMPGMDGFEVLRKLRDFTQLPVIAFSASPGNYHEAMRLGANDFISKPFQPDEMASKIEALLAC